VAIRSYVSNLRRAVDPNRRRRASESYLANSPPGYRLAVEPPAVDWVRFETGVAEARRTLIGESARGALAAADRLRAALGLWRGEPCSGLPESEVFLAHRTRLTELRRTAIELLLEARLHAGDHQAVAAEVAATIEADPLRERLTELGMLALYRAGRQSEALAAGQRLRAQLVDQLGIDPSPGIAEMERKILQQDPSLGLADHASVAAREITPGGEVPHPAPRGDAALDRPADPPGESPSGAAPDSPAVPQHPGDESPGLVEWSVDGPIDLPPSTDDLAHMVTSGAPSSVSPVRTDGVTPRIVGRAAELRRLAQVTEALLADRSMVAVISGEPGVGKSTLAGAVARAGADRGAAVARALCLPGAAQPFWPWSQLIDRLAETGPAGRLLDDVSALPGGDRSTGGRSESTAATMVATTSFLSRLSVHQPLVLVIEDLQWADPDSIRLLSFVAAGVADRPVAFVATIRSTETVPDPARTAVLELSRIATLVRVDLEGLSVPAVADLADVLGVPAGVQEAARLRSRTAGNPLYLRELLLNGDAHQGEVLQASALRDAVRERVGRLQPRAARLLGAASLFRGAFTAEDLAPLDEADPAGESPGDGPSLHAVEAILGKAVWAGLLDDADPVSGGYRFRHPVVAETLAADLLGAGRRRHHRAIGHRLLDGGALDEAAYHLSWSDHPVDRLKAARLALDRRLHEGVARPLCDLDRIVAGGLSAWEAAPHDGVADARGLVGDALAYLSWRARVGERPDDWLNNARRAVRAGLDELDRDGRDRAPRRSEGDGGRRARRNEAEPDRSSGPAGPEPTPLRGAGGRMTEGPLDRLERAVCNLAGWSPLPAGIGDPGMYAACAEEDVALLRVAGEALGAGRPARWVGALQTAAATEPQLYAGLRSRRHRGQSANREAGRVLSGARKRLQPESLGPVIEVRLARFCEELEPEATIELLEELAEVAPGPRTDLAWARFGYPALLATGQVTQAEQRIETARTAGDLAGDPFLRFEAEFLHLRSLLWRGQLGRAADQIGDLRDQLRRLDLPVPLPLVGQGVFLAILQGRRGRSEVLPVEGWPQGSVDWVGGPDLALRSVLDGRPNRAAEQLDALVDAGTIERLGPSGLACAVTVAASIGHHRLAEAALPHLLESPDRLVATPDGSVMLGPFSLWAAVAGHLIGNQREAEQLLTRSRRSIERFGGCGALVGLVAGLVQTGGGGAADRGDGEDSIVEVVAES
jgi:DNA-binding SARP family transcriptional activator